jgi:hypothetical protein
MSAARAYYPMIALPDGRALAIAGAFGTGSTELYNPTTNAWNGVGNLSLARESHAAIALTDGRVLVTGGNLNVRVAQDKAELFELVPNGRPCTLATECASGFCADGVCCSTACTGVTSRARPPINEWYGRYVWLGESRNGSRQRMQRRRLSWLRQQRLL